MYQRYFEAFPKVWTASAFKGMCFKPTSSSSSETNNKLKLNTTKVLFHAIDLIYIYAETWKISNIGGSLC